jgi:diguanylate cyclase (GGDEF)-like protein/PAS domain S-box-containing protein
MANTMKAGADGIPWYRSAIRLKLVVGMIVVEVIMLALLLANQMQLAMLIAGATILFCILLLTSGGYQLTRNIPPLVAAARRIARGDDDARVTVDSRDDIGALAADFNAMAAAVEKRVEALQEGETRFREIFDAVDEAIFIHDPESGLVLDVNRRTSELYGFTHEQIIAARDASMFSSGEVLYTAVEAKAHIRRAISEGPQTFEWHAKTSDGRLFWVEVSLRLVQIGKARRVLAVVRDVSEYKQHQSELEYLAHHDPLTRLPNRLLLGDRLSQAIAQSRRSKTLVAVGYLDLDGFKPINDEMGHDGGDRLLVEVAERLKGCIREGDTLSRFGGDEFVVVLGSLGTVEECTQTFDRILDAVSQPYLIAEREAAVSTSIGVSIFPLDDGDPDTLIRHADQAMYSAKQAGRNRIHQFDPEKNNVSKAHQEARARIELGLGQREFVLHYQPKVDLRNGAVIGAEALIRWQHPERGLLAPAHFLPVINDTDFSITLGRWVIEAAVTQLDEWLRAGLPLTVNINVAARHLQSDSFVSDVKAVLANHPGVPPYAVELEVLETTALEDIAHVSRVVEAGHRLGVRFALDDFGTGYVSLAYFKSLKVDTLKIDRSFVRNMLDDAEDQAIVDGIVGLTRAFRRQVVAEGVETAAHCVALINLGCHFGQGYGIARPMPAEELGHWVRNRPVASR